RAKITSGFSESFRREIVILLKIRNPNSETNPKDRNPNRKTRQPRAGLSFGAFWILNLFRISDFGLRICRASNAGWPGVRIPPENRILFWHRPLVRLQPVLADTDLDHDGNIQRQGVLHLVFDQRGDLLLLRLAQVEHEFVVDLEDHARLQP